MLRQVKFAVGSILLLLSIFDGNYGSNNNFEISDLRNDINILREQNVNLLKMVKKQSSKINNLENRYLQDIDTLTTLVKQQSTRLDYYESCSNICGENINRRQARKTNIDNVVAFYAHLTTAIQHPIANQVVKFEKAITNIGESYNANSGIFTCRVPGTYLFSWTIFGDAGGYCHTELVRNGDVMAHVYFGQGTFASTGSNTAILQLDEGDRVFVKIDERGTSPHIPNAPFTSFSGVLLD